MSPLDDPAIPKGSIALVTGVNGLVGSHVADKFLEFGYVVRGTVRDTKKSDWLTTVFDNKYGKNKFELVSIPDMKIDGAFDEAAKGVSAVVHVATVNSFDPDPLNVIPPTISGALNAIRAAYAEPSVKRFVLTSSSAAAFLPTPNVPGIVVAEDTWNDVAVKLAWGGLPLSVPEQAGITYAASKTQSEQEVWKFHNENKEKRPDLVVNTILPNLNFGQSLDIVNQGYPSTSGFIVHLWRGENLNLLKFFPPQWFVDVQDVGLLHVAASIHRDVKGERIFGFAETTNWDKVLAILRKHNPEMKFIDDFQGEQDLSEIKPRARAEQLLRDLGRPGWTSLEDSILANTEGLRGDGPAWTNLGQTQVLKIDQLTPAT